MVERLLYVVLFLSIVINVSLGVVLYNTSKKIDGQTQQIESYMHCIVLLFAQPNRSNVIVTNISKCSLTRQ